jgi:hypothetical protein
MKKYLFWLFGATLALTACNQNPAEQNVKVNDYEYLVDGLMRFDDEGNITGYMIGDNLNQADPLEISVPVKNYDEAVAIFRSLLPENANVKQEDKKYSWLMTDSLGGTIGELTLDTLEDGIAIIKMKGPKIDKTPAKRIKAAQRAVKCLFIPESAWPENSGAAEEILKNEYYLGAIVNKSKDEGFGSGTFVVIAPWTPQECGLMIKLDPNASYFDDMPKKKCSSANTLHRVSRELNKDNNYQEIFVTKGQEVGWPETLGGWYLTKTKKGDAYYCVNLETNGEKFYNPDSGRKIESAPAHRAPAASSEQKLRMAYCYCFRPDGDKIKFW